MALVPSNAPSRSEDQSISLSYRRLLKTHLALAMRVAPFGMYIPRYSSSSVALWGTPRGATGCHLKGANMTQNSRFPDKLGCIPHSLLDDTFDVWQRVPVGEVGKTSASDHSVDLFVGFALYVRVGKHACDERCYGVPALCVHQRAKPLRASRTHRLRPAWWCLSILSQESRNWRHTPEYLVRHHAQVVQVFRCKLTFPCKIF